MSKPTGQPNGRPTKYTDKTVEVTQNYINNFESFGDAVPTVAGLSFVLDVTCTTIYAWGNEPEKADFSVTLEKLQRKQEQVLINKGMTGEHNAAITKLMLANHNYIEKRESKNEHTGKGGKDLNWTVNFVSSDKDKK